MDSDQGKLFIGGISWETSEDRLREHFGQYGEVAQAVIMRDKATGRPRGFGFVAFSDPDVVDRVLLDQHTIDGRTVEAKRALSREEQHTTARTGNSVSVRTGGNGGSGGNMRTKKIFVGGLPPTLTEEGFRQYFSTYGTVTDVVVMYDQTTQRPRGFGFVSFDSEDAVDRVLHKTFHELNGKMVEVKRALPKDANPSGGGSGGGGGRSGGGGNYQSYGGTGNNTSTYDGRMDSNRYMQTQAAGGGYPPYGSSGYGAPNYGYGAANSGYGGYGYGSGAAGYSGPGGAYGNPSGPQAGYMGGPPGGPRSPWNNQAPSGYASTGYGANTGYGAASTWNAPAGGGSGGSAVAPTGQSPGGNAGYGNQGYGYGGYGGNEGSYGNQGYGAVGGRSGGSGGSGGAGSGDQAAGSGYMGGAYGDANGNSGYSNSWRSDASQGGGYGGPYGGGQPRQAQQQ